MTCIQILTRPINCRLTILGALGCLALLGSQVALAKQRVIVTTDGEVDDRCSMIRFLLYANEWDIQGLIHSSSKYHWKGDDQHPPHDWEPVAWLDRQLDAYGRVYPNLKLHQQEMSKRLGGPCRLVCPEPRTSKSPAASHADRRSRS